MSGGKMNITNEALVLFLKSLPVDSMFEIISFGDKYEHMSPYKQGYKYTD